MKDWIKLIGLGVLVLVIAGGIAEGILAGLAYLERKHRDHFDKLRCTCHFTNVVDTGLFTNLTITIKGGGGTAGPVEVSFKDSGIVITNTAP